MLSGKILFINHTLFCDEKLGILAHSMFSLGQLVLTDQSLRYTRTSHHALWPTYKSTSLVQDFVQGPVSSISFTTVYFILSVYSTSLWYGTFLHYEYPCYYGPAVLLSYPYTKCVWWMVHPSCVTTHRSGITPQSWNYTTGHS